MVVVVPATELLPVPARGRRFTASRRVRLGDVDPRGRMRLDAIARHLQDVASDDAADSGLDGGWVVRRTLIDIARPAVLGEDLHLTTFCTGTGRAWAERRTSIVGDGEAAVEAVSLWVHVDPASGRPAALGEAFHERYGEAAGERRVSTRLALPAPPATADVRPWVIRTVDLDVFDHVNNASHWPILEAVLTGPAVTRIGVAEMEYLVPVDLDTPVELHTVATDGHAGAWLVADGRVHTASRWRPASIR
jgi:acyl-ACP thioesterase